LNAETAKTAEKYGVTPHSRHDNSITKHAKTRSREGERDLESGSSLVEARDLLGHANIS